MAIYSLNLEFISRSEGRSAVGFSAYISGGKQQDTRTGVSYDYGCKNDVIVSRVLAPEGAPGWAKNSSVLWNKVEQFEDEIASLRFRGDIHEPEKNQKSLEAKKHFLNSAQTAQMIMGAIPIEFTQLEAEACVEEFLKDRFVARGLIVEYAIHWDEGNPHFHGLITRRPLADGEFSQRKDRDIVTKAELFVTRKQWEVMANKYLALGGHEVRIDSRSYADQGLDLLPTHHEGWYAQKLAERGQYSRIVADNETVRQKNIEILCKNPAALIQEVALKRTVFTRQHLEEEILRRVGGDEKLFAILKSKVGGLEIPTELILKQANDNRDTMVEGVVEIRKLATKFTDQLLSNEEIVYRVGENINRDAVFTSSAYKKQEDQIIDFGDVLYQRQSKSVSDDLVAKSIQNREIELGFVLSDEQRAAIIHLCSGADVRVLNGKAGTGKTTLLKAVAEAYQEAGYRVLGTSFQGKAVEIMEQEIGISCKTLDSFKYAWEKHQQHKDLIESDKLWGRPYQYAVNALKELEGHQLSTKDVVIVDEANMVGNHLWEVFLKEATDKGAKVLIVQDPAQIKSRGPGDTGRLFAERFGFCETNEVVRQRIPWQRECSKALNDHQVLDGLKPYYEKDHIKWVENGDLAIKSLTQEYVKDLIAHAHETRIALAYRNSEVYELNQSIRNSLKEQGNLQDSFKINGEEYAIGDRIRFTQNDHHGRYVQNYSAQDNPVQNTTKSQNQFVGVKNGTFGTIEAYDEAQALVTACLDGNRLVQFNTQEYQHITHGYAMGIHKSEGSTFDKSFVSLDPMMDPSTLLVGMTRHRQDVHVFVNREQFIDFKDVVERIGRPSLSQTVQDYHIRDEQKPYFNRVQQYRDLIVEASTLREEMEGELDASAPLYKHSSYPAYQTCFDEKKRVAEGILKEWRSHAPYVRLAGIRKDVLEVEAGLRPRLLSDLEHRASIQVQGYMDLVRETRSLWKTISESRTPTHPGALAKSHPLYEDYQFRKVERDSIAFVMQETPRLYAPFFKVTKDETTAEITDYWGEKLEKENRVYFTSVKSHAAAHNKSQLQNLFYNRLSQEQKTNYDEVKAYVNARNDAAAVYSHLKKQESHSVQVTSSESGIALKGAVLQGSTLTKFHEHQAQRDALALKLVESPEKYTDFFTLLNVKEDKLLEHAVAGELREKIHAYAHEQDISKRASQAQELKRILTTSVEYRIFNETSKGIEGIDINRLTFDIVFHDKLKSGEISSVLHPDQIYKPIQSYLNASKEASKLWKTVQLKGQENPEIKKEALNECWEAALQVRNENARALMGDQMALVVLGGMGQGLQQRVYQQAERGSRLPLPLKGPRNDVPNPDFLPVDRVLEAARGHTTTIATDLLGSPNTHLSTKTSLRFGKKGSLVINVSALKEGLWKDFESGEGGNIIHLIQREKGMSFKDSISYLADVLNVNILKVNTLKVSTLNVHPLPVPSLKRETEFGAKPTVDPGKDNLASQESPPTLTHSPTPQQNIQNKVQPMASLEEDKETAQDIASRLNSVSELQMKSKPLEGTVAEIYLREERGIRGPLTNDLRYLSKGTTFMYHNERKTLQHACLAAFGRTYEGRLSSVQLTKLTEDGKRALALDGEKLTKIQYGIAKGSFVCLQEDKTHTSVFIAEGVETALSIKEAGIKGKIIASLGIHNISNYQGPEKEIILCGDNDDHKKTLSPVFAEAGSHSLTRGSQTHALLEKAQDHFKNQDKIVSIIKPSNPGDDFNDVLKKQGIQGVQEYLKPYLDPEKQLDTSQKFPSKDIDPEKQPLAKNSLSKTPALERSSDHQSVGLERQDPSQSTSTSSHSTDKFNSIDLISDYLNSKLKEIKVFEGTSLGEEAKHELKDYIKTLQKNETLFEAIKEQNKELAKNLQRMLQEQERMKMQSKDRGMDLGM